MGERWAKWFGKGNIPKDITSREVEIDRPEPGPSFVRIPDNEVDYFVSNLRRRCRELLQSDVVSFYLVTILRVGDLPSEQVVVYPNSKLEEIGAFVIEVINDESRVLVACLDGTTAQRRAGYNAEYEEYIKVKVLGGRAGSLAIEWGDRNQVNQMIEPYSATYKHFLNAENVDLAFWSFYGGSCWTDDVWIGKNDFRYLRTSDVGIEHFMKNQGSLPDYNNGILGTYGIQVLTPQEMNRRGVYGKGPTTGLATTRGDKLK